MVKVERHPDKIDTDKQSNRTLKLLSHVRNMSQAILDADDKSLVDGSSLAMGMRRGSTGGMRNSLNSSLCMDRDNSQSKAKLLSTIMDLSRV